MTEISCTNVVIILEILRFLEGNSKTIEKIMASPYITIRNRNICHTELTQDKLLEILQKNPKKFNLCDDGKWEKNPYGVIIPDPKGEQLEHYANEI